MDQWQNKKKMRIRDWILRKLKKNSNQSFIDLYKQFRNRVSVSLNESKASYFYNYFQQNSNNMKKLWSGIKSVVSIRKSSNMNVINKLKDSNVNITSDPAAGAAGSKKELRAKQDKDGGPGAWPRKIFWATPLGLPEKRPFSRKKFLKRVCFV